MNRLGNWPRWIAIVFLVTVFGVAHFARAMEDGLNHDEHQFLAPAVLLARHGLLPFQDYPVFHLPTLTLIYALLAHCTSYLVFVTKGFSIFCASLTAGLVVWVCCRKAQTELREAGILSAALLLCILFFDRLYDFTTGKIWNHEFPALCLVVALICIIEAARGRAGIPLSLLAGAAVGAAIGARLTFAPIAIPLGCAFFFFAVPWPRRFRLAGVFGAGLLILLIPAFWLWVRAPENFIFDNFQFPRLRLLDPDDIRVRRTMSWWRKMRFFVKEIAVLSWPLFLAYLLIGVAPAIQWFRNRSQHLFPAALILVTLPFLFIGCGAPSRYQYQHYFAFIPVLALGIAYGLQTRVHAWLRHSTALLAFSAAGSLVMTGITSAKETREWIVGLARPEGWLPVRMHEQALAIRSHVEAGKVLTLGPILPLEAGLEIYPEFATGPFAWRGASLVEPARRRRLHFVAPDDLGEFLAHDPPAAVLTGFEKDPLELPLIEYAKQQNLRPIRLVRGRVLWVR